MRERLSFVRLSVAVSAASVACLALGVGSAQAVGGHASASKAPTVWRYSVQVDGHGPKDEVVVRSITLHTKYYVTGRYRVTVQLDGGKHVVSKTLRSEMYATSVTPHAPYFGATNLDQRPGDELLFGVYSGANYQCYEALTYRAGSLDVLPAPAGSLCQHSAWVVGGSAGDGEYGWKCLANSVQWRDASPVTFGAKTVRVAVTVDTFRFESGAWRRTRHSLQTSKEPFGQVPARARGFEAFDCAGLTQPVD